MTPEEKIKGSWTRTENSQNKKGISTDTFNKDGSKSSIVTIFENNQQQILTYKTTWNIKNNKLYETLVEITDDKHCLLQGYKVGDVIVSKIKKLELKKLVLFSKKENRQFTYARMN